MNRSFVRSLGTSFAFSVAATALVAACGNPPPPKEPVKTGGGKTVSTNVQPGGQEVKPEAADAFTAAVMEFKKHEEARDWDDGSCSGVSAKFLAAGKAQGDKFPAAHYNAGVTLLRCGREADATAEFDIALAEKKSLAAASSDPKVKNDPEFHQVWVQKAMIRFRKGDIAGIGEAIETITSKGFDPDGSQNVEAFVSLGLLYRERWNRDSKNPATTKKDDFGFADDLARAQFWLQNALSINDSFMPAYNQLALFYLDKARHVGKKKAEFAAAMKKDPSLKDKPKADIQTLELGLLVSEEASRRDPGYAGIWNTQGLILLEMNRTSSATKAFAKATDKDAKFFEAWMNYAAINLQFRGWVEAAKGYEKAKDLRPKDYDAKLGYAVALRGQLDGALTYKDEIARKMGDCADPEKSGTPACKEISAKAPGIIAEQEGKAKDYYTKANTAYDAARDLDANRPEAHYNKALLVEKYSFKVDSKVTTLMAYEQAEKLYNEFVTKFQGKPEYEKLVKDAKSRAEEAAKSADFERKAMATPAPTAAPAPAPAGSVVGAPAPSASVKK